MKPRYSFSSRRTRNVENIRKQKEKYPQLAKRIIEDSDIILQVLDARFIEETRNLEVEESIKKKNKKIIYVLNKADLIDKKPRQKIYPYIFVSCILRKGIKELRDLIKREAKKIEKKEDSEKDSNKSDLRIKVGIIGYPNTGKSSLINLLIGKNSAKTAPEAGFTKGLQKLRLSAGIILIDSPGIIPQSEYSNSKREMICKNTKIGGRSYNQVKEPEIVVCDLIKEFPERFEKFYKINSESDPELFIEKLGKQKGFLKKAGKIDEDKTSRKILRDWQEGKIR
jgi:ribosome biogenesis GTPase A